MALRVGFWTDLAGIPDEGPFVVGLSDFGGYPRIEHAKGPDGVGCPQVPGNELRRWMEEQGIPRGDAGADALNEHWRRGDLEWRGAAIVPRSMPPERHSD